MKSVGEFSVSEGSVERVSVLWVVLFFFVFFGKDLVCFKVCRAF